MPDLEFQQAQDRIPGRSDRREVLALNRVLAASPVLIDLLEAVPLMAAILDRNRQIVLANTLLARACRLDRPEQALGKRFGELIGCAHAWDEPTGCGTSAACSCCGALDAVLAARGGASAQRECQIATTSEPGSLELRVKASLVRIEGDTFTVAMVEDIADQKRRFALERTFFHDIMNTAGNLRSIVEFLKETAGNPEAAEFIPVLDDLTRQILEEIASQRDLVAAEAGCLEIARDPVWTRRLLREVAQAMAGAEPAAGIGIQVDPAAEELRITTGRVLLRRVLANLLKNALEASNPADIVTMGCRREGPSCCFWVNNKSVMPFEVKTQMFRRSFTTKGVGRGLGTYSVKLLTEKYLSGSVTFVSEERQGTTFFVRLPLDSI